VHASIGFAHDSSGMTRKTWEEKWPGKGKDNKKLKEVKWQERV